MSDTTSFAVDLADGRKITVDAADEEQASRLALEQSGGVRAVKVSKGKGASKSDEKGKPETAGTPSGPFGATTDTQTSGGNAGVGGGAVGTDGDDGELKGEALHERAKELDIEGRSDMSADELRAAVAAAESEEGGNDGGKA